MHGTDADELVKRIKSDDMFERENVLNQLLVRNRQVYIDSVTKVYNRRYYDERLKNLEGRFSFAMIDMDNFKHINDRFGHQAGDTTTAFRAVNTLKGVALNLGLGSLAHASSQMTEALRAVRIRCLKAYSHSMWRCRRSTLPCAARSSSSKSN